MAEQIKKHYYEVLMRDEKTKTGWRNATRVPPCNTVEEAMCYLTLLKLGRWKVADIKDGQKEFMPLSGDYRIFETTINTIEVEIL